MKIRLRACQEPLSRKLKPQENNKSCLHIIYKASIIPSSSIWSIWREKFLVFILILRRHAPSTCHFKSSGLARMPTWNLRIWTTEMFMMSTGGGETTTIWCSHVNYLHFVAWLRNDIRKYLLSIQLYSICWVWRRAWDRILLANLSVLHEFLGGIIILDRC
jgi:hypothetical protein